MERVRVNYVDVGECADCPMRRISSCPDYMLNLLMRNTVDSAMDGPLPARLSFPLDNDGQIVRATLALASLRDSCVELEESERPITLLAVADLEKLAKEPSTWLPHTTY